MTQPRVMFALSSDFGEYVTASIFSRGQPFFTVFALPPRLMRYAPAGRMDMVQYEGAVELLRIAEQAKADVVVLASGYLFPVGRLATPEALRDLIMQLTNAGHVVATTDPWLRIWALRPESRFEIYSVSKQGVDPVLSEKMQALRCFLEQTFQDVPHLFAAPIPEQNPEWMPFFNPEFTSHAPTLVTRSASDADEWLFVISKEDFVFLTGFEREAFYAGLKARINELLQRERNYLRFIGPPELQSFLQEYWRDESRIEYLSYCDFQTFELALRRARIVAYWNVISSTLLYCLYYRIPVIFFGKGHQAKVCSGLFEHAMEHLYRGRPPNILDINLPLDADVDALIKRLGILGWLDHLGGEFARLPSPHKRIEEIMRLHAG